MTRDAGLTPILRLFAPINYSSLNAMIRTRSNLAVQALGACAIALGIATVSACSSAPKQPLGDASQVQVYRSMQLTPTRYTVVKRIWIDELRSNVTYPSFASEQAGIDAMKQEAAKVGANGIMHVICLDPDGVESKSKLLCYGDAIKVN